MPFAMLYIDSVTFRCRNSSEHRPVVFGDVLASIFREQ